jgi:type III secretion protein V
VVLGVAMLIAPLPPSVLDAMVAVSLFSATLIMLGATYAPSMLSFSSLPTLLLITTLFRLSLEVAITRQVLLEAHAGDIVLAFGEFVVGGNLAVGLIVFIILTVVNFLVVTKGSERVAEVGARFSLDAMPGRQMAIDTELRAGAISAEQASERRLELSRASEMHGAMDGAMKFVKGDAIAAIVILVVNLLAASSSACSSTGCLSPSRRASTPCCRSARRWSRRSRR